VIAGGRVPGGGPAWLRFLLAAFVASFTRAGFVKLPHPVGFRVGQRVRITLGAANIHQCAQHRGALSTPERTDLAQPRAAGYFVSGILLSTIARVQLCDRYPRDAIALADHVSVMRLGDCDRDARVTGPAEEAGLPVNRAASAASESLFSGVTRKSFAKRRATGKD
jgi:hypothetical protein